MMTRPVNHQAKVPIVILAGSDRRPGPIPEGAEKFHFVVGYKGAQIKLAGRALIELLVERLRAADVFDRIYLAGPRRIYQELVDCEIVDTDGHVGENIRAALDTVEAHYGRDTAIAFIASDILPTASEIAEVTHDLMATVGEGGPPGIAFSLVEEAEPLGASSWKPKYRFHRDDDDGLVTFLPGHLGVVWPARLRVGLLLRLLDLAYEERNLDYDQRRRYMLVHVLGSLLWRDLQNLFRLRAPLLTWSVLSHGLGGFVKWRKNELSLDGLAAGLGGMIVRRRYYRRQGAGSVRLVVTPHSSFAKDIDTQEELEELSGEVGSEPPVD